MTTYERIIKMIGELTQEETLDLVKYCQELLPEEMQDDLKSWIDRKYE